VYVVDDDLDIGRRVCATLDEYGFRSEYFLTAAKFMQRLRSKPPALAVIDLGLPDLNGLELIRHVQSVSDSAILVLTSLNSVNDRIVGLEVGADDYMVKPFEPREVVARVNTILRRLGRSSSGVYQYARFGEWTFEPSCNRLTGPGGVEVELSIAEARLLETLLKRPNRILTRAELLGDGDREPLDRSIDTRVSRLRKKLQTDGQRPELIKTVYGGGYMLVAQVDWE